MTDLELQERAAHVDVLLADHIRIMADIRRIDADHDRKRQEIKYQPWIAAIGGMTAGGALVAGLVALIKIFGVG